MMELKKKPHLKPVTKFNLYKKIYSQGWIGLALGFFLVWVVVAYMCVQSVTRIF